MNFPWNIKKGDQVSATWMNLVVSCLRECYNMQARRRILRGVGYTVSESPGGTSLTIDKQAIVRVLSDDLDIMRNEEFQVRLKPKGLCKVDEETGNWDKIVQVHVGRITNHHDFTLHVTAKELSDTNAGDVSSSTSSGTAWDATDWVDMGVLQDLGQDSETSASEEENGIEVFAKVTFEGGLPMDAVFCTQNKTAEDGDNEPTEGGNIVYIPIGKISGENVEGTPRYYITQYQQGPIELGGSGGGAMPFDVAVGTFIEEPETEDDEPQVKACLNVAGGRIFLPERKIANIPDKNEWQLDTTSGESQYVILTLSRDSNGGLLYKYELAELSELGTEVTATEEGLE